MTYDQTVEDLAEEYVECLNSAPDGWGQHIHHKFGASHYLLRYMNAKFGLEQTTQAVTNEFKTRRNQGNDTDSELSVEKEFEDSCWGSSKIH